MLQLLPIPTRVFIFHYYTAIERYLPGAVKRSVIVVVAAAVLCQFSPFSMMSTSTTAPTATAATATRYLTNKAINCSAILVSLDTEQTRRQEENRKKRYHG